MPKNPADPRLSRLPKVDRVMRLPAVERLVREEGLPRWAVLDGVRGEIARLRDGLSGTTDEPEADAGRIAAAARSRVRSTLQPVINATGVVLHTNLGRAPLPAAALRRVEELAGGYLTLEYRLDSGERGSRQEHAATLIQQLTGAEACLVVNNNAAAVLLMLTGLCGGREVVVSRGELVEIGGSFRIPDVMRASGARLREVGTTNRTHLRDYQAAIGPETRALLKVHRSNFAIVGFTAEVEPADLARCAHDAGLLCLYDLGSGAFSGSGAALGLAPPEPTVEAALLAGCDVVSFSCDKLLGGPQAGVLCGSRAAIEPLRQHPLLRALRPDKLTLLALTALLELYRDGRTAEIPTVAMLGADKTLLHGRAEALQALCKDAGLAVELLPTRSAVGGGAMPLVEPESWAVSPVCEPAQARRMEAALRQSVAESPVVARLAGDRLLCDVRTVRDDELPALARALVAAHRA